MRSFTNSTLLGEQHLSSFDTFKTLNIKFQNIVKKILFELELIGWDPLVRNGLRSQQQANKNKKAGSGAKNSLHLYGLAADIVPADHCDPQMYDQADPQFWEDLASIAESHGLRAGLRFKKRDRPHIDVGWQNKQEYS